MGSKGMNRHSRIVVLTFVFLLVGASTAFSQTANDYFDLGKTNLANDSLVAAHTNFQNALSLDPNHQGANFFYALTRILMIFNSAEFNSLLDRAGVTPSGRDILNWEADFSRDAQGNIILPANTPTGEELQNFAKNSFIPEINGALINLNKVSSGFQTSYNWAYDTGRGDRLGINTFMTYTDSWVPNEWIGYKLVVGGSEYAILSNTNNLLTVSPNLAVPVGGYDYKIVRATEIDYGDALVIKGGLYLAKVAVFILSAFDFNVDIDTIVSLSNAATLNIQTHIVQTYQQLLNLLPTHQLAQAKMDLQEAITQLTAAVDFIAAEGDPQDDDFFTIYDAAEEANFRAALQQWGNALNGPAQIQSLETQVNLVELFDNPKNLRNYLPTFDGTFIKRGSFPDPTFGGILPVMTSTVLENWLAKTGLLVLRMRYSRWIAIEAGGYHSIALNLEGKLGAWGSNWSGCLGDGSVMQREFPVQIGMDNNWASIAAGDSHTLALKSDGTLWAWGTNWSGQLGDGTTVQKVSPVRIGTDSNWVSVAGGGSHTLALKSDGTLWAWGWNGNGQLGDGTTVQKVSPVRIGTDSNWVSVAGGGSHTLALKSDGKLWAWGWNGYGQLGDGTTVQKVSPVRIGTDSNWVSVAAGGWHSLALKSDGALWAWGANWGGQLGDGTTVQRISPVRIGYKMGILDLNEDGKPDILWRNSSTGENYVWYMNGATFGGSAQLFTVLAPWEIVGVADFNADGNPDLLWRNPSTGENYVWFMNGTAFSGSAQLFTVPAPWKIVGTGDFNNDGNPDLLWRNTYTGENYVWFMNGVTFKGSAPIMAVSDQNWKIVGVGDFNNDGNPDILWRNTSTGENYVWYMNGVTFNGSAPIMAVSDQNWTIVGPK